MTSAHDARRRLLGELRASGSAKVSEAAARLEADYHAREMAMLSHDVYDAARQVGNAPPGWRRATADLASLRQALPRLDLTDEKLRDLLTPEKSGFRAEIYLPDPAVLGPGYKPTVVFKGSKGEVIEDGTLRRTAREDFLGNNLPQSLGIRTDYYDRAMDLAMELRKHSIEFDLAGHSLGGGMAAAASAVTGMRAVTHNAAGLHANTAQAYARNRGGLTLYDTDATVTAWQVRGDLLNDSEQDDLRGKADVHRARMAMLVSDTVDAMQRTPAGRDYLQRRLVESIPETARPALRELLDRLQTGDAAAFLRNLPEAAGARKPPLVAMTRLEHALIEREDRASIGELQQLGAPLLTVLAMGARGANVGAAAGQVVAEGGQVLDGGSEAAGVAARYGASIAGLHIEQRYTGAGRALDHGAQAVGEATAQARLAGAHARAAVDQAGGWAQYSAAQAQGGILRALGAAAGTASDSWQQGLETHAGHIEAAGVAARDRSRDAAAAAIGQGRLDASGRRELADAIARQLRSGADAVGAHTREHLVYVGDRLDAGFEVVGGHLARTTSHAPTLGAGIGGVTGAVTGGALTFDPRTPRGIRHWSGTIELMREAGPGIAEAVGRHGIGSAVLPSLERHVAEQEAAARALLQRERNVARGARQLEGRPALWTGDTGIALERLLAAVGCGDSAAAACASARIIETDGAKAWLAVGQAQLEARGRCEVAVPDIAAPGPQRLSAPQIEPLEQAR